MVIGSAADSKRGQGRLHLAGTLPYRVVDEFICNQARRNSGQ